MQVGTTGHSGASMKIFVFLFVVFFIFSIVHSTEITLINNVVQCDFCNNYYDLNFYKDTQISTTQALSIKVNIFPNVYNDVNFYELLPSQSITFFIDSLLSTTLNI
jgi:hypothetical protein